MVARSRDSGGVATRARGGFSIVELVVVIIIAAVIMGMSVGAYHKVADNRSVKSARDTYGWMARRARAAAVQRGQRIRLVLVLGTAQAILRSTPEDRVDFRKEYGATVTTSVTDSLVLCFDPRGMTCSTAGLPATVTFSRGGATAVATVQALGQVEMNP